MRMYTINAVDQQGNNIQVKFPAVTPLMAQAWVELCHEANKWKATEMVNDDNLIVWSKG